MQLEVGSILEGKVTGITKFGVFVDLGENTRGMVHISEVSKEFVNDINDFVTEGQTVKVMVLGVGEKGKISLSIKQANPGTKPMKRKKKPETKDDEQNEKRNDRPRRETRQSKPDRRPAQESAKNEPLSFEDMMSKFKQTSDEKMSALKKGMQNKRGSGGYSRRGNGSQRI